MDHLMSLSGRRKSVSWTRYLFCQDPSYQSHYFLEVSCGGEMTLWAAGHRGCLGQMLVFPGTSWQNLLATPSLYVKKGNFTSSRDGKHFLGQAICCGRNHPLTPIPADTAWPPDDPRWGKGVSGLVGRENDSLSSSAKIPFELY